MKRLVSGVQRAVRVQPHPLLRRQHHRALCVLSRDPCTVLGVARSATQKEIKTAYVKAARATHPDTNPGVADATERFQAVQAAYAKLADPSGFTPEFELSELDVYKEEVKRLLQYPASPEYSRTRVFCTLWQGIVEAHASRTITIDYPLLELVFALHAKHKTLRTCLRILHDLQKMRRVPDEVTLRGYNTLLWHCETSLRDQVDRQVFLDTEKDAADSITMIQVFEDLEQAGLHPDDTTRTYIARQQSRLHWLCT
jgi:hypothetical protein